MLKAILFDLDGTLLNTTRASISMYQRALGECGYPKPPAKKISALFGNTAKYILEHLAPDADEKRIGCLLKASARISLAVIPLMRRNGVSRSIPKLAKKCRLGVVTNRRSASTAAILRHFRLSRYFHVVVAAKRGKALPKPKGAPFHLIEAEPKPSAEGILAAMRRLGAKRGEVLFVGDHECDRLAGKNAGVKTLIISRRRNDAKKVMARVLALLPAQKK